MGRAGLLAIAVVLALANTALADERRCDKAVVIDDTPIEGPSVPADALIDLDNAYEVSTVSLTGSFDRATMRVKITLIDLSGSAIPTQTVVVDAADHVPCTLAVSFTGAVLAMIETIDADGNVGRAHYTATRFTPPYRCGLGAVIEWFFATGVFALISFVAIMRRLRRGTNGEVPIVVSLVFAEALARRARSRDAIVAALVTTAGIAAWTLYGNWVVVGSVWILLCIGDYWVATRTVSILERPHAVAELYGTNLVVRADDHTSAILLSRRAIRRAKRDALPRALLQ